MGLQLWEYWVVAFNTKKSNCSPNLKVIVQHNFFSTYMLSVFSERELMFTFAICRRPSVCRLSYVVCLSVRFVRPTQAIEIFGNVSMPFGTLATL